MDRHDVPAAHIEYCVRHGGDLARLGREELARQLPSLPFPPEVRRLVRERLPFVLAVGGADKAHFRPAFAEATPSVSVGPCRQRPAGYATLQMLLAKSIGEPYRQHPDLANDIVHDVFPAEDQLDAPNTSAGATAPFGFHTDKSCSATRAGSPGWVTLACVRNLEGGVTSVASLHSLTAVLAPADRSTLGQSSFRFGAGRSNVGPILGTDGDGAPTIRLSTDMTPLTPAAATAYRALLDAADAVAGAVVLAPGEVLFLPNRACVHSRHRFVPHREPGRRRFLQRVYIRG
ncbi:MAG: TauD/TfdA family dioxygenase [Actinomycetota bacterium]